MCCGFKDCFESSRFLNTHTAQELMHVRPNRKCITQRTDSEGTAMAAGRLKHQRPLRSQMKEARSPPLLGALPRALPETLQLSLIHTRQLPFLRALWPRFDGICVVWYRITSWHTTPYQIRSYYVRSHDVTSYHFIPYNIMPYHIIAYHSSHITP